MSSLCLPRPARPVLAGRAALLLLLLAAPQGSAQEVGSVAGRVLSTIATGSSEGVPGVTVRFPSLRLQGVTDARGRFAFAAVPAGRHEIRVEVVGCEVETRAVEVRRGASAAVEFVLDRPAVEIAPVVVTGAPGEVSEVELPFAVGRVDAGEVERRSARTIADLIRGELPGARIVQGSGLPGSEVSIQLRGPGSITGERGPLVVVDGVVAAGGLVDLVPRDVRSIRVLKGAAAAALYGARGGAGVIEIATRRGASETRLGPGPLLLVDGVLSTAGLGAIDPAEIESMQTAAGPAAAVLFGAPAVRAGVVRITTRSGAAGASPGRCSAPPLSPAPPKEPAP